MKKVLFTAALTLVSIGLLAQVSSTEKQALLDLYMATNGANWTQSWDVNAPVEEWQGVTVTNNKVTAISLLFNKVKGKLPATIGNLEHLKTLELSFNEISGQLPESLGQLGQLEVLAFNGNNLSGEIPSSLGKLKNLKKLHLSSNSFSGTIPTELEGMGRLEVFNVFDNNLGGDLPVNLASNKNLRELMIAENDFTNTENFSVILMSNSAQLDFKQPTITPTAKTVIAVESNEDN